MTGTGLHRDHPPTPPDAKKPRSTLVGIVVGNALEWYDWNVYAVFATYLATSLFDKGDPVSALLSTFAVFAAGFVTRPLGGIVFGALSDRVGRRTVLVLTMIMTAGGSLVVGLTPDYEHIGVWASVILLLARLVQGMGHGGESAAAFAYVAEIAPAKRRGLWSSSVFVGVSVGTLMATGLGAVLTATLSRDALETWGWRIPFVLGGVLGVAALYLRRTGIESEMFEAEAEKEPAAATAIRDAWPRRRLAGTCVRIIAITCSIGVTYYSWIVFGVGNATDHHGMSETGAFVAALLAQSVGLLLLPFFGRISDRVGRRPLALGYAVGSALFAVPITLVLGSAAWTLFVSELMAVTLWAMIASIYPTLIAETLPTALRSKGIGIATSIANAVFGGSAPYLAEVLRQADLTWVFTTYTITLCLVSAVAVATMRETRAIDLSDVS